MLNCFVCCCWLYQMACFQKHFFNKHYSQFGDSMGSPNSQQYGCRDRQFNLQRDVLWCENQSTSYINRRRDATEREYSRVIVRSVLLGPSMKCIFVVLSRRASFFWTNHLASWFKLETRAALLACWVCLIENIRILSFLASWWL